MDPEDGSLGSSGELQPIREENLVGCGCCFTEKQLSLAAFQNIGTVLFLV